MPVRMGGFLSAVCAALMAAAVAGCLDLEITVKINEDGSALVTERVRMSEEALDLASTVPAKDGLDILLRRERAESRVPLMGKDVKLVSHEVKTLPGGAKECITIYSTPDVNNLTLCSAGLTYLDTDTVPMRVAHAPHYTDGSGYNIGMMTVVAHTPRPRRYPRENPEGYRLPIGSDTPADLQKYRDLLPAFKDLMQDFSLTYRIECYAPVTWATGRGTKDMTREYYIMKFDFKDLDQYGNNILDNEEFMLALIRWDLRSPHFLGVVAHQETNLTVPVWRQTSGMGMREIALRPSSFLFAKYFKGKPKFYGGDLEVPKPASIHAREELIKWGIIKPDPPK